MFKQPCFIRKDTQELRDKLKEIGLQPHPCIIPKSCAYLFVNRGFYSRNEIGYYEEVERAIDCGTNEELFLSLAALRDDTDKYQWFKSDKGEFCKCYEHIFYHRSVNPEDLKLGVSVAMTKADKPCADPIVPQDDTNCWHKATVEELIEYFKYAERKGLQAKFQELAQPLIDFINDNYHPYCTVIIDCTHAELLEGLMGMNDSKSKERD